MNDPLRKLLNFYINKKGLRHPMTILISQKLDKQIAKEQIAYNKLKKDGKIAAATRQYRVETRIAEIKEQIKRVEEINNEQSCISR